MGRLCVDVGITAGVPRSGQPPGRVLPLPEPPCGVQGIALRIPAYFGFKWIEGGRVGGWTIAGRSFAYVGDVLTTHPMCGDWTRSPGELGMFEFEQG
jgi:hypothetical protein